MAIAAFRLAHSILEIHPIAGIARDLTSESADRLASDERIRISVQGWAGLKLPERWIALYGAHDIDRVTRVLGKLV